VTIAWWKLLFFVHSEKEHAFNAVEHKIISTIQNSTPSSPSVIFNYFQWNITTSLPSLGSTMSTRGLPSSLFTKDHAGDMPSDASVNSVDISSPAGKEIQG
jgi:hypothetical protein